METRAIQDLQNDQCGDGPCVQFINKPRKTQFRHGLTLREIEQVLLEGGIVLDTDSDRIVHVDVPNNRAWYCSRGNDTSGYDLNDRDFCDENFSTVEVEEADQWMCEVVKVDPPSEEDMAEVYRILGVQS